MTKSDRIVVALGSSLGRRLERVMDRSPYAVSPSHHRPNARRYPTRIESRNLVDGYSYWFYPHEIHEMIDALSLVCTRERERKPDDPPYASITASMHRDHREILGILEDSVSPLTQFMVVWNQDGSIAFTEPVYDAERVEELKRYAIQYGGAYQYFGKKRLVHP